jgi:hypothetical protein
MIRHFFNVIILTISLCNLQTIAQVSNSGLMDTVGGERINNLSIGGYVDAYYGFNFSRPTTSDNPYFVSMNRHNEANINLAFLDIRYQSERVRARFVPGFGTYINANYSAEDGTIKNIVEGSVGYKLFSKKEIWVEAGVLGSPYTNESAISRDHLMYTRSLAPEYVPYYLSGVKLSVPLNKKWNAYLYLLNGWQQIKDQNTQKAIGTQIEYRPNSKNLFNWNTFIGDERSPINPNNRTRYFTDIYWIYNPDGKFSITSCAYIGLQQKLNSINTINNHTWWQGNFIGRYTFTEKFSLSGRVEYFSDPASVQITPITGVTGFQTSSAGLCANLKLANNLLFRFEGRKFFSSDNMFTNKNGSPNNTSTWLISSVTVWF